MLVLSRRRGQRIVMPQCNLTVSVIGIKGNTVRLGITAPPEMAVHREELWQQIEHEHARSSETQSAETQPAAAQPAVASDDAALAAYAVELREAARRIALRHGLADRWTDLEQRLPPALVSTTSTGGSSDATVSASQPPRAARLPR